MIISRLIGGLGNQMFQVAAGYAIAQSKNVKFKIDVTDLKKYKLHNGYQLNEIFEYQLDQATQFEIYKVLKTRYPFHVTKIDLIFNLSGSKNKFRYFGSQYNQKIQSMPDQVYLDGYWQSEKYFINHKNELRKLFKFKKITDTLNQNMFQKISTTNSVAVHVRRGDYSKNKLTQEIHGICKEDYYINAVNVVKKSVASPTFFVFSDDHEVAKKIFQNEENAVLVAHNTGLNSYKDMALMAHCTHHIIANSTFSWWAAWLSYKGGNKPKLTIAPQQWYAKSHMNSKDIYPDGWITL